MARPVLSALILSLALCLLTGCASFLEREYTVSEPHSSKFWESEAADTLRAENYQDIVNDLLLLIAQHGETATLRLYDFADDIAVSDALEAAAVEVQQETPLGAYAVDYITFSSQAQRSFYEVSLEISYRRSAEQVQSIRNATSASAVYTLLESALRDGEKELAVRIAYWGENSEAIVKDAVAQLRSTRNIPDEKVWVTNFYPHPFSGTVAMAEFLLDPSQAEIDSYLASLPPAEPEEPGEPDDAVEGGSEETGETGEPSSQPSGTSGEEPEAPVLPAETGPAEEAAPAESGETPGEAVPETAPSETPGGEAPVPEAEA